MKYPLKQRSRRNLLMKAKVKREKKKQKRLNQK
jgi:hypothetical protein